VFDILILSLQVAVVATLACTPLAILCGWLLARPHVYLRSLWESLITVPMFLPPVAIGLLLLHLLSEDGVIGKLWLNVFGERLLLTWWAASFASAVVGFPLYVRSAQQAFQSVSDQYRSLAAVFGKTRLQTFLQIELPLAARGIFYGASLCFLRGLGEFGATSLVAGIIPGKTETLSLAIYANIISGNDDAATLLSLLAFALAWSVNFSGEFFLRKHVKRVI
jgi:molybdate transport system permease protein